MKKHLLITVCALLLAAPVGAQTLLNTTTVSTAVDATQQRIVVGSTSNITAGNWLFVPRTGELMRVNAVPVSGTVQVQRAVTPTRNYPIASSTTVIIVTTADATITYDPGGACTRGSGLARYSPVINLQNGNVWVCRSSLWAGTNLRKVTVDSLQEFTGP